MSAERAAGWAIWKLVYDLVKDLSDVMQQTLPSFWKVAKGYMEGKYQKVSCEGVARLQHMLKRRW